MTKKDLLKQIFGELSLNRNNAIFVAEQNKKMAESNKKYFDLELEERIVKMNIGKAKFEGKSTKKLETQLATLDDKKKVALKEIGLQPEDLLPKFNCLKCGDTGIFENEICSCVKQKYNNKLMELCGVDLADVPYLNNYDFKFFGSAEERKFAEKCVVTLEDFVKKFDTLKMKNIVMCGASGTGKTYLTKCIAKELIAKNITTLFVSSFDLNNLFLEQHTSNFGEKNNMQNLIDVDALIVDDLGTEPMRKNVTKEYLLILLNERLGKNKSTIITTNLSPDDILARYEERIFSRIFNKRTTLVLKFEGKNVRLKKWQNINKCKKFVDIFLKPSAKNRLFCLNVLFYL